MRVVTVVRGHGPTFQEVPHLPLGSWRGGPPPFREVGREVGHLPLGRWGGDGRHERLNVKDHAKARELGEEEHPQELQHHARQPDLRGTVL